MNSHKVDVVIAEGEPMHGHEDLAAVLGNAEPREPEQVDVAPDPHRRIIYLAATKRAGLDEAKALGIEPVAVVTPRSLDAARGIVADAIEASAALLPDEIDELMPHVAPSLATTGVE
ncbi:hypothetical protein [Microbacterium stercoris]|uniref:Uncharacterized protein n=1 Tax=Microbacterium stercoris TaxID=2820289 RepID=A0A939TXJ9_9MICO|nr:hypothetical protein [Microbacterium stercoris]MBO3663722.1 hypothetical protein [Microbacterium stercoris]